MSMYLGLPREFSLISHYHICYIHVELYEPVKWKQNARFTYMDKYTLLLVTWQCCPWMDKLGRFNSDTSLLHVHLWLYQDLRRFQSSGIWCRESFDSTQDISLPQYHVRCLKGLKQQWFLSPHKLTQTFFTHAVFDHWVVSAVPQTVVQT